MAKREVAEIPLPTEPPPGLVGFDAEDWRAILSAADDSAFIRALDAEAVAACARARFRVRKAQGLVDQLGEMITDLAEAPKWFFNVHANLRAAETQYATILDKLMLTPRTRSHSRQPITDKAKTVAPGIEDPLAAMLAEEQAAHAAKRRERGAD